MSNSAIFVLLSPCLAYLTVFSDESYGGKQLRRGYWDMARTDDRLPPIGHVVFVIHGIGQCMEGADICKTTSE